MAKYTALFQQGDLLLKRVKSIPAGAKPKKDWKGIFAEGEVTGHMHATIQVNDLGIYEDENGTLWAEVENPVTITHQEHHPVTIEPGKYEIGIVREVDPFEDAVRRVAD